MSSGKRPTIKPRPRKRTQKIDKKPKKPEKPEKSEDLRRILVPKESKENDANRKKLERLLKNTEISVDDILSYKYKSGGRILDHLSLEEFLTLHKILTHLATKDHETPENQFISYLIHLSTLKNNPDYSNIIFESPFLENEKVAYAVEIEMIQNRTVFRDTNIPCPNKACGSKSCYFEGSKQKQRADEGAANIYVCRECQRKFER